MKTPTQSAYTTSVQLHVTLLAKIRRAWWGHTLARSCKATQDTTYQSIKIWMKYIVRMKLALSEQNAQGFLYLILYPASI